VEPWWSFEVGPHRETQKLEWTAKPRQCLFWYHYGIDPVFGGRKGAQSWFPFPTQICRKGREWLAQQRPAAGME
jgi:hypothetical protein